MAFIAQENLALVTWPGGEDFSVPEIHVIIEERGPGSLGTTVRAPTPKPKKPLCVSAE